MPAQSAEWIAAARLVRRAGFGATGSEVDSAMRSGAASYLHATLAADPGIGATPLPTFERIAPAGKHASATARHTRNMQVQQQLVALACWWVRRMVTVSVPVTEKVTFCWHRGGATEGRDGGDLRTLARHVRSAACARGTATIGGDGT